MSYINQGHYASHRNAVCEMVVYVIKTEEGPRTSSKQVKYFEGGKKGRSSNWTEKPSTQSELLCYRNGEDIFEKMCQERIRNQVRWILKIFNCT